LDEALLLSFDELEERHWWFVVRRRIVLDAVHRWAPEPVERVLEVGCGTGGTLRALAEQYPHARIEGVEPVPDAVAIGCRKGCSVTQGSFERLPAEDASVDLLLALDVLEHLDDDVAGLAEARRVLKSGGTLVVTVPALPSLWGPHDELNAHRRRYLRAGLVEAIGASGLRVERATYFNSVLLPLGYAGRVGGRLLSWKSDPAVNLPVAPVNAAMRGFFGLEAPWLRRADLPCGMSLLAVARKD
jgi:SAM-dependent methyltransferase